MPLCLLGLFPGSTATPLLLHQGAGAKRVHQPLRSRGALLLVSLMGVCIAQLELNQFPVATSFSVRLGGKASNEVHSQQATK